VNPVRAAIFAHLSGDATLTGLLAAPGNIFHSIGPQTAAFPLIVFNEAAGTRILQFAGAHIKNDVWQVKAIASGSSETPGALAEDIAARVDVLLDDAVLAITGREHLYLRNESDIPAYPEQDGAESYWHCGSLYRLFTQPT
jgi:hypothetical protein